MQQRQPRLGDILDDYCPRERRLTNHAVVAMIGDEVKQTRCTTCESEHEYKHARVPRQRRKPEQSALYSQVLAHVAPKKVVPPADPAQPDVDDSPATDDTPAFEPIEPVHPIEAFEPEPDIDRPVVEAVVAEPADIDAMFDIPSDDQVDAADEQPSTEEGPAHRRLIRAQLPRHDGQVSTTRQGPDFTIRQPNNPRANRFRPRPHPGGGAQFQGNRGGAGNGNSYVRGGVPRSSGRPGSHGGPRGNHRGPGRNRSK
jgi:hypothetical protein